MDPEAKPLNFKLRDSISVRFLRIVFGCYLFVTVAVTSAQLYVEYSEVEDDVLTELANVARSFEDGLAKALWNLDNDSINFILSGIIRIEVIDGAKVVGLQNDIQGAVGAFLDHDSEFSQIGTATNGDIQAKALSLWGIHTGNYYEYSIGIIYEEASGTESELIGHMSLYANRDTVVQRFKHSFFLILVIALVKTLALWLIFLYFARRIVAKPLTQLIETTQALSKSDKRRHQPHNAEQLAAIAESKNHDEIQLLASGFLEMQKSILEKFDNLHSLNDFAIHLSRSNTSKRVFEHVMHLLSEMFGCRFAVIFNGSEEVYWSSIPEHELTGLVIQESSVNATFGLNYYDHIITYVHEGATYSGEKPVNLPMLTLPLVATGFEGRQLRFFGALHPDRLTLEFELTRETRSFLQVVAAMVGNTLTNISQREVIEDQKQSLEIRVRERTHELAELNAELKHLAVHDPLTQLPNRTLFNDRLEQLIHLAHRDRRNFAVASIDLAKFKQINDTFGHDAGDTVLIEVGRRFSETLRSTDTLARMGGDEFAAILTDTIHSDSIDVVMRQLMAALDEPVILADNTQIIANANIGIAIYPQHAQTTKQLFKYADIAMYQAKRDELGYSIFDIDKTIAEKECSHLMNELELAITCEELALHYQPIVDLKNLKIVGFEALVRWMHPVRGMILPGKFIPKAEKSQHISPLTRWVLRRSCEQCVALENLGHKLFISVNLSPSVFSAPNLPADLKTLLDQYDLEPDRIKLEITETTAMSNPDQALEILSNISAMGSPIAIDDFGTGHSSLAYLTRLPIKELKIDRSFLISDTPNNRLVVETLIELAHALDLKVVAEGIETKSTSEMLIGKGCDYAQGFYFGRPLEAEQIPSFLLGNVKRFA